jgi:glycosyltransferase involved in cell wall biosynthesis
MNLKMTNLRILQIHTYMKSENVNPRAGGKSRVSLMLSRYLLEHGHEVAVYSWPEKIWGKAIPFNAGAEKPILAMPTMALPTLPDAGPDYLRIWKTHFPERPGRTTSTDLFFFAGLKAAIRQFKPDLLHCHQTDSDIPALLQALGRPVPAILTHHSGRSGEQLCVYDRIIFLSLSMQEEVCRRSGLSPENSAVVYYPILEAFQQGKISPASSRRGIVCVGRLTKAKGVDLLLEAYRTNANLRKHPLTLCGAGDDEQEFRDFVRQHDLPVFFQGRVTAEQIRRILSHARLLVNPSRLEGFSVALLEALACGTPVVGWAPQVRELGEWWTTQVGFPFDGRTQCAAELAELVSHALQDPMLRTSNRYKLSRLARESFSMERYGEETLTNYRTMLESL